jgi:hypothetical protein
MLVLNLAGGKFEHLPITDAEKTKLIPTFEINVDTGHYADTKGGAIESHIRSWEDDKDRISTMRYLKEDAFTFMERTILKFDRVAIYRFLEHVSFTSVLYFIYLVSTVAKKGALIDIIVPNYETLAEMLIQEEDIYRMEEDGDVYDKFENWNIQLTTELLNEPSCPHASIWTPFRAKLFWQLEQRFRIDDIDSAFEFDGRNVYMRVIAERL